MGELHREAGETPLHKNGLLPELFTELNISLEELRVAEEELRQQNETLGETRLAVEEERQRYQDLFDFAPDGYLVTDPDGKILEANRAAGLLLGVSPRHLANKPLAVYVGPDSRPAFRAGLIRLQQEAAPVEWETVLRPRQRRMFPAAVTVSAVRNRAGSLLALRWLVRDITERKAWETRLQQANHDLEQRVQERTAELEATLAREQAARAESTTILESITDAFYAVDQDFCFTYVNRRAEEWFGRTRAEMIGGHIWTLLPQAVGSESYRLVEHAMAERQEVHGEAVSALTGKWIEVNVYPSGAGLSVYFRDITERKRAEQAERLALDHNRRIADTLQTALLQTVSENAFPGLALSTLYKAASDEALVGGDFFDAYTIDNGMVALIVGDVSGKGLAAAAHITEVKYALRAFLREAPEPALALARLNDFICEAQRQDDWGNTSLVVLALAVFDPKTGEVDYVSAGAEPLLVLPAPDAPEASVQEVGSGSGLVLGVEPGRTYKKTTFPLPPGGMLLMTTDGITEARRGLEMLGLEGLKRLARECQERVTVGEISQAILERTRAYAGGSLTDDACILLAQRC